jgi:hypothetical protein
MSSRIGAISGDTASMGVVRAIRTDPSRRLHPVNAHLQAPTVPWPEALGGRHLRHAGESVTDVGSAGRPPLPSALRSVKIAVAVALSVVFFLRSSARKERPL